MGSAFLSVIQDLARFVVEGFLPHTKYRSEQKVSSLYPRFESRRQYYASNTETLKLRLRLSSYPKEKLEKPLTAIEFILYKLKDLRLYTPEGDFSHEQGFLHSALKGKSGIHTSIRPTRHAVMEIFDEHQQPKLLFVENVFGDDSIEVESIGLYVLGEFRYDVFTKKEWQEWRPVFISFIESV